MQQGFKQALLQTLQYFLGSTTCSIFIVVSPTSRAIQVKSNSNAHFANHFPQPKALSWEEIQKYILIPGYDKVDYLKTTDTNYFDFFDLQFDFGLDKKFFSFAMNTFPDDQVRPFLKWLINWSDTSFITFKQLAAKPERFWMVFDTLRFQLTNAQLLDIYNGLNVLDIEKEEIDKKMFDFFSSRPEILREEKHQLSMYNAISNILGPLNGRKYLTFLSPSVAQSIDKKDFIRCLAEHIMCLELDQYSFYHQVQFYPLGGYGETVFQQIIEKCLKEIIESGVTPVKKYIITNPENNNKYLHIFIHCEDNSFSKDQLIDLIQQCARFLRGHQSLDKNWTSIQLHSFIMHQMLQQQLVNHSKEGSSTKGNKKI